MKVDKYQNLFCDIDRMVLLIYERKRMATGKDQIVWALSEQAKHCFPYCKDKREQMSPEREYVMRRYMFIGQMETSSQKSGCICHMTEMQALWTQNRVEGMKK